MQERTVVIAPDSFKGSLAATGVARAIAEGWSSVRPQDTLTLVPLADGGEGTLDAIEAAVPGAVRRDAGQVTGPDTRPVRGEWLQLAGDVAVIELAQMSGLPLMDELRPLTATTLGLGQVIRRALDAGARRLVIGLGGSASTDAAAGALSALGLRASDGSDLPLGGAALLGLHGLDDAQLLAPPPDGVLLLTDVDAPLLGPRGAAAVFAPQKGANADAIELLEEALAHFSALLDRIGRGGDPTEPGGGAAGGAAYGLAAAWGATITPGAGYLAEITGLHDLIASADVVISGEGRFDATSIDGKLVGEVIRLAGATDARIGVIAGSLGLHPTWNDEPIWAADLVGLAGSMRDAMRDPAQWLHAAGAAAARALG